MKLENFFNPKTVAVIGASSDRSKVGYALMANLLDRRGEASIKMHPREIYPISISEPEIMGIEAYKSVKDIPTRRGLVDLAIIAVRADLVPRILEECAEVKIQSAIIISAGFREIGPAGIELEEKVREVARRNHITLLGPNCLGIINTRSALNASFSAQKPPAGTIGFISQSGALGTALMDTAIREGVGFSKFISLGNEAGLTEIEMLEYLGKDPDTRSILIYLEKLSNGPEFMKLAAKITMTKPVVVLKAGRSERGQRAVMSHTGSLAPEDSIFSGACRQCGVITVESIREFFNMAKLFQMGIMKSLRRLVILTNGGGPSVVAADLVETSRSLSLVEIPESVKSELRKVLPPMAAVGNPIDIIGDALSSRYANALRVLVEASPLRHLAEHRGEASLADVVLLIVTPQMMTETEATAKIILGYRGKLPIIPVFIGGPKVEPALKVFRENGLVNFAFPKDAVEALDNLGIYNEASPRQQRGLASTTTRPRLDNLRQLSFRDMKRLLDDYKMPFSGILLKSKNDIIKAVSKLGKGPFALKGISPDIVHKTEAGMVHLHIGSVEEAEKAWDSIHEKVKKKFPEATLEGVVIQAMGSGKETIIGMKRDPVFGPTILFGLGGIFTEALKDVSLRVAPVSREMGESMIAEIKGAGILSGLRGEKPVDATALADIMVRLSKLVLDNPRIKEVDLNPVMATSDGAVIVDARMMV